MRTCVSTSSQKYCEYSDVNMYNDLPRCSSCSVRSFMKSCFMSMSPVSLSHYVAVLMYENILQAIWCPGPCTTSSRCTSRTPAMGLQSTRRPTPQCTGSLRPSILSVTSCTAHRWNGRTPTLSLRKSPYRLRGESKSNRGNDAASGSLA